MNGNTAAWSKAFIVPSLTHRRASKVGIGLRQPSVSARDISWMHSMSCSAQAKVPFLTVGPGIGHWSGHSMGSAKNVSSSSFCTSAHRRRDATGAASAAISGSESKHMQRGQSGETSVGQWHVVQRAPRQFGQLYFRAPQQPEEGPGRSRGNSSETSDSHGSQELMGKRATTNVLCASREVGGGGPEYHSRQSEII